MDLSVPFAPEENLLGNFIRILGGPGPMPKCIFSNRLVVNDEGRRQIAESGAVGDRSGAGL